MIPHNTILPEFFGTVVRPAGRVAQVVITVQHDGLSPSCFQGLYAPRTEKNFRDLRVMPLALDLFSRLPSRAALVYNAFPRDFLDTNRDPEWEMAFADGRLAIQHAAYHREVRALLQESVAKYGRGRTLLIDLHGFTSQPSDAPEGGYDVILGTFHRQTILRLEDNSLWPHLDARIAARLTAAGLKVFLPKEKPEPAPNSDADMYDGGYCISHHFPLTAAAILIEAARPLREKPGAETEEGRRKRTAFLDALGEMIETLCQTA